MVPGCRDRRREKEAAKVGTYAQNAFHTAHHNGGSGTGQPVDVRAARVYACLPFRELSVAIGLDSADLCLVVLHGGCVLAEIAERPFSVPEKGFGQNQPSLGLGEDAAVLFRALVVDDRQRAVKSVRVVGRIHKNCAVRRVEPCEHLLHCRFSLLRACQAADHRPGLRVEPEICLRRRALADGLALLRKAPDKAVLVPAQCIQLFAQRGLFLTEPAQIFRISLHLCKFLQNSERIVVLERDERGFPVGTKAQAVIPVRVESCGHAVRSEMMQGEVQRAF